MPIVAEEILPPEREEKADKPGFLYDVGAGVIVRRDAGGGGGCVKKYNVEKLTSGEEYDEYIIHGMTLEDNMGIVYFHGVIDGVGTSESDYAITTCPYVWGYADIHHEEELFTDIYFTPINISDIMSFDVFHEAEPYLDGVKVKVFH